MTEKGKKKRNSPSPQSSPARGEDGKNEGRWRSYNYDELVSRDKASLDIFRLKDESLEASDNLPDPDVIALEIVGDFWGKKLALAGRVKSARQSNRQGAYSI